MMSLSEAAALSARPLPPLSRMVVTLALTVAAWELRHRTRKHLNDLSQNILTDIGLDRHAAQLEAEKPFWRA
jgi:uncharacterized protein YjiS (DUF1127 family)